MEKAVFNWSGGKDSMLALHKIISQKELEISYLLTTISEQYQRVSQHGVRSVLLEKQVEYLGFDLHKLVLPESPSMEIYNALMRDTMLGFKNQGITTAVFGDIFLEDLRKYREDQLNAIDIKAVFPLWKSNTLDSVKEFIELGYKAIIVCVDSSKLDRSFVGRNLDMDFINDLPSAVDPCGENGEYHSFVFDGPLFKKRVDFEIGEVVFRTYSIKQSLTDSKKENIKKENPGFWFCDLVPC